MRWLKAGAICLICILLIGGAQAISIKNRSYWDNPITDSKAKIQVVFGNEFTGTSANTFSPAFCLTKWEDSWLSILPDIWPASGTVSITVNMTYNIIKATRGNITITVYNYTKDGGGIEYDITLASKPKKNQISYQLTKGNTVFYYQPPLTEEPFNGHIAQNESYIVWDEGMVYRPPDVVGSYAIYRADDKNGNLSNIGGMNYQNGKVGHIYRPKIYDSKGNWTYGTIRITDTWVNVTIPQEFLDSAVYPIRQATGTDFGYTTCGGSTYSEADTLWATRYFPAPASGTIASISACVNTTGVMAGFKYGIANETTLAHMAGTVEGSSNSNAAPTFITLNIDGAAPSVVNGYNYTLGFRKNTTASKWWADSGIYLQQGWKWVGYSSAWPNPWAITWTSNNKYSIYATYSGGAGTTYDATFSFSPLAAVRNGTITLTNKSAGSVLWFGNGSVPCLSSSATPNVQIFSKNFSYCNICLTVKDGDGANANTSCKFGTQGPYILQPWAWF